MPRRVTSNRMKKYLTEDGLYTCDCGKKFESSQGLVSHMGYCKTHCDKAGKKVRVNTRSDHKVPWRDNYSKDDPRYLEVTRKLSEAAKRRAMEQGDDNPLIQWNKRSTAGSSAKRHLSETMKAQYASGERSLNVGIGRGKYSIFRYKGKEYTLRSTYEFIYALYMADHDIDFDYEVVRFNVDDHTYIADFLVDNTVIEVRGCTERYDAEVNRSVVESEGYDYKVVNDNDIENIRNELNNKYDMDYLIKQIFEGHNSKNLYEFVFEDNEAKRLNN